MSDKDKTWASYAERGREVRERYLGKQAMKGRNASEELIPELADISDDANWGAIWGRPGLDLKIRSLCTISVLMSLERYKYAYSHIRGARRLGVSKAELTEVMAQLTFYAGLAVAHEGLALVKQAFDEDLAI